MGETREKYISLFLAEVYIASIYYNVLNCRFCIPRFEIIQTGETEKI